MLFTAPAFIFVFLPMAIIFYTLFGKNRKKLCLALICAAYYILMNISAPINYIWLPLTVLYVFVSGKAVVARKSKVLTALLAFMPLLLLIALRYCSYYELVKDFVYPVGITLPLLCAAAYIWTAFENGESGGISSLWLYLSFFPVMLVGPFVTYRDFCRLTDNEALDFSLIGVSEGIGLFARGFIKRIAVGAVLIEGYGKIFAYSWDAPSLSIILLLLLLIYFGIFYSVSGYYDMGVGISRMFGLNVPQIDVNPFTIATINEYSKGLFRSVRDWSDICVISPVRSILSKRASAFLKISVYCLCTIAFVNSELWIFVLAVPLVAFAGASASLRLDKAHRVGHAGLRVVFGMLTVLVMGAFWVFVTMGGGSNSILEYLADATIENAEYQTDMVLIAFSGTKYLFVVIVALLTVLPWTATAKKMRTKLPQRFGAVVDYGSMVLMLLAFLFTAVFFLPQFEIYNSIPFTYIII